MPATNRRRFLKNAGAFSATAFLSSFAKPLWANNLEAALRNGQSNIHVHIFPFRFDNTTIAWQDSEWKLFWSDLKIGFDAFNKTKKLPTVSIVNKRYQIVIP